jgi:sugar/nucleoside kinase (ribokinase family)
MIRAARIARQAGIPVIADFDFDDSPKFPELLALADHLIVSQRFASKLVGDDRPAVLAEKLWTPDRQVVAITCGIDGAWFMSQADPVPRHQSAFPVNTVDSTGCGDVFHGAYAVTLVRGFDVAARIRFAAAAAAIKATQPGGQAGIPTWDAVEAFLRERGQSSG